MTAGGDDTPFSLGSDLHGISTQPSTGMTTKLFILILLIAPHAHSQSDEQSSNESKGMIIPEEAATETITEVNVEENIHLDVNLEDPPVNEEAEQELGEAQDEETEQEISETKDENLTSQKEEEAAPEDGSEKIVEETEMVEEETEQPRDEPTTEREEFTSTTTEEPEEDDETFGFFSFFGGSGEEKNTLQEIKPEERVNRLSDQIRTILEGYRQFGVVTIPGAPIPDPLLVPDFKKTVGGSPISFKDMKVFGLSNFTVDHINTDIEKMQVFVALHMKKLLVFGNYSMRSWLSRAAGPFNVTLIDVEASGAAEIERDSQGNWEATETELDMTFLDAEVHFENMGLMGALIKSVAGSVAPVIFDAIKPTIMKEVNTKIRTQVNDKLKKVGEKFNGVEQTNPIDKAVAAGRTYVREQGYDPYKLEDKIVERYPVKINISSFVLNGLSRFYRVGDVGLSMDSGTVQATVRLATKRLTGSCRWSVSVGEAFNRSGDTAFTVKHLQVRAAVNQSLDVSRPPVLEKLDINLGPVRLDMDRGQSFHFIIEFLVNTMPALIRHIIVDTLEAPLMYQAQKILDQVDVEALLDRTLPELDNMGV